MHSELYDLNPTLIKNLDYPNFMNLCKVNKEYSRYCNDNHIWAHFLQRDFPLYLDNIKPSQFKSHYQKLYHLFDIVAKEMLKYNKTPFLNTIIAYHHIFKILTEMTIHITEDEIFLDPLFDEYTYQLYLAMNGYDEKAIIYNPIDLENYIKRNYVHFYGDLFDMIMEYRKYINFKL